MSGGAGAWHDEQEAEERRAELAVPLAQRQADALKAAKELAQAEKELGWARQKVKDCCENLESTLKLLEQKRQHG